MGEDLRQKFMNFLIFSGTAGRMFEIELDAVELAMLHGFILVALKHPGVQTLQNAVACAESILDKIADILRDEGFSDSEIELLNTMEEEVRY